ncbi:hypothetical protein ACFXCZ_27220 [Streptomyces sp. NPDC059396]|uniref:hypothetical protein n=1 Tax=Streptomyces sp. NPDC059396 TaxID=3346819 RepID=UPI0036856B68
MPERVPEQGADDAPERRPAEVPIDTAAVAGRIGVTPATVRLYLKRTRRRIAADLPLRPQDFPLPDVQVQRSPAWLPSTIDAWMTRRPGRGRTAP